MADDRATKIVQLYEQLEGTSGTTRNRQQEVADHMLPRENQITSKQTPGQDKTLDIFDPTPMLDLEDMVSGISSTIFPPGQLAFAVKAKDRKVDNLDHVKRYLSYLTQTAHDEIYASNFMLQLNETLSSIVAFGTGNLFSEFLVKPGMPIGLNYKDWDIPFYQFLQNANGRIDTMILKYPLTALQAIEEFGDLAGEEAKKAAATAGTSQNKIDYIHYVAPRKKRNPLLSDPSNMEFESLYIEVKERRIIDEGGFREFPFAAARWMLSSNERWGRGQGTKMLSSAKTLQQMWADLIECGNKHNNPPRQILDHFEGRVRVMPGANNFVREKNTIMPLDAGLSGNFPITEKTLEKQHSISSRGFFVDVFAPLTNLTGDRRTTLEIRERVKQAMKKLALPIYRLQVELFTPVITRSILLLIRNGRIDPPPPELVGKGFGIEYMGELALAMRDQQTKAFQQFTALLGEFEAMFPGSVDVVSPERALPDVGISLGVKAEHLATPEEMAAKRQARQQRLQMQQEMQALQAGGRAYKDTSKAPEAGSAAAQLQEQLTGA